MSDLADLFPGFESRYIGTDAGRIFVRIGGQGSPLVLVHGFPESGAMWGRIAPELARSHRVVVMDLRGYGWSSAPASRNGERYTKRAMGEDVVAVMDDLGHARFSYAGHDRCARVGYRLALDHPGRIERLALLDIVPTMEVWRAIEAGTEQAPHWPWLAQPEPVPENEIKKDPDRYFTGLMAQWSKSKNLASFDPRALAHYKAAWGDPSRIHAMCEDYRAGAGQDRQADEADEAAGKRIACPAHILDSTDYLDQAGETPLDIWHRTFAPQAAGTRIESGHFIAEENAPATLALLQGFFAQA